MLFLTLSTVISSYSVFAIIMVLSFFFMKDKMVLILNKYAGSKKIILFEVYSWGIIMSWLFLTLPLFDLIIFQKFSYLEQIGLNTVFGQMSILEVNLWYGIVFLNILGVKAAFSFSEIASMLRKGRIRVIKRGMFNFFMPEGFCR